MRKYLQDGAGDTRIPFIPQRHHSHFQGNEAGSFGLRRHLSTHELRRNTATGNAQPLLITDSLRTSREGRARPMSWKHCDKTITSYPSFSLQNGQSGEPKGRAKARTIAEKMGRKGMKREVKKRLCFWQFSKESHGK